MSPHGLPPPDALLAGDFVHATKAKGYPLRRQALRQIECGCGGYRIYLQVAAPSLPPHPFTFDHASWNC